MVLMDSRNNHEYLRVLRFSTLENLKLVCQRYILSLLLSTANAQTVTKLLIILIFLHSHKNFFLVCVANCIVQKRLQNATHLPCCSYNMPVKLSRLTRGVFVLSLGTGFTHDWQK